MKQLKSVQFQLWILRSQLEFGITQSPTSCSSSEFTGLAGWTPVAWWQPLPFLVGISNLITSVKSRTTGTWEPHMLIVFPFCSATRGSCFMPLGKGLWPWEALEPLLVREECKPQEQGKQAALQHPALTAQVPVGRTSSFQGWLCSDNSSLAAGLNTSVILFLHCCSF